MKTPRELLMERLEQAAKVAGSVLVQLPDQDGWTVVRVARGSSMKAVASLRFKFEVLGAYFHAESGLGAVVYSRPAGVKYDDWKSYDQAVKALADLVATSRSD